MTRSTTPYLRARAADLRDVARRLARLLAGGSPPSIQVAAPPSIVVARDLTPSDVAGMRPDAVRGIVLAEGAPTAHAAILARGLAIPLVTGVGEAIQQIEAGQALIVDGADGTVLVGPDAEDRARYRRVQAARHVAAAPASADRGAITLDGRQIGLLANVAGAAEARRALDLGAEGIGLLRTEFLIAGLPCTPGDPPDEAALAGAYGAVMEAIGDRPLVVRALDAGGDKPVPFLDPGHEANPALGWRGIRVLLGRPDLLALQVRALSRAAARHNAGVRLLLPMVSTLDELLAARRLIAAARADLGIAGAAPLPVGVMIETPAAALIADVLAREADFLSLGTSDLVQYTLACDRGNARVGSLYQPLHPAVLRLIDMVVRAAHTAGRSVSVCGEAAGDATVALVLIGLGVDALSVAPDRLTAIRARIGELRGAPTRSLAAEALARATAAEVGDLVAAHLAHGEEGAP